MARIKPEILGRLFDEHAGTLALVAKQWCDTPDDVVRDAFACLATQKTAPDRVVPWLFRVVRNRAISASRAIETAATAGNEGCWIRVEA
jgi:RNA polymerase sigma-70 factor (ECF subfamily)